MVYKVYLECLSCDENQVLVGYMCKDKDRVATTPLKEVPTCERCGAVIKTDSLFDYSR